MAGPVNLRPWASGISLGPAGRPGVWLSASGLWFNASTDSGEATMGQRIAYFEIGSRDHRTLLSFYRELFGWRLNDVADSYTIIDTQAGSGINGGIGRSSDGTSWVSFYAETEDPQATLDRAE